MNLALIGPKVYDTEERAKQLMKFMLKSCEIHDVELKSYGFPTSVFPGFLAITTSMQLDFIRTLKDDFTHLVYSDTGDAFLVGSWEELISKYKSLNCPEMLVSTSNIFFPVSGWKGIQPEFDPITQSEQFLDRYYPCSTPFRVPQVGGYIAEIPYLINIFERMLTYKDKYGGDNAHIWRDSWVEGWFRPERDSNCKIFQTFPYNDGWLDIKDNRLHNTITNSFPCIMHFNGGYSSSTNGKYDFIHPWWIRIYPGVEV